MWNMASGRTFGGALRWRQHVGAMASGVGPWLTAGADHPLLQLLTKAVASSSLWQIHT
jgi:hypothetical protein